MLEKSATVINLIISDMVQWTRKNSNIKFRYFKANLTLETIITFVSILTANSNSEKCLFSTIDTMPFKKCNLQYEILNMDVWPFGNIIYIKFATKSFSIMIILYILFFSVKKGFIFYNKSIHNKDF
jgi:hypothetical protein